jgi:hypothetical protein
MSYLNVKDFSDNFLACCELIQNLIIIYHNAEHIEIELLREKEKQIQEMKYALIDWLNDEDNYNKLKESSSLARGWLYDYLVQGFFNYEIGIDSNLEDKIRTDFKQIFEENKHSFITKIEKENIEIKNYENEKKQVLNIFDKEKCFSKNFHYINRYFSIHKIPSVGQNLLEKISIFPYYLSDHPYYFLVRSNQSITLKEVFTILKDSSLGNKEAIKKIENILKLFNDFDSYKDISKNIQKIRKEFQNDNQNKNEILNKI